MLTKRCVDGRFPRTTGHASPQDVARKYPLRNIPSPKKPECRPLHIYMVAFKNWLLSEERRVVDQAVQDQYEREFQHQLDALLGRTRRKRSGAGTERGTFSSASWLCHFDASVDVSEESFGLRKSTLPNSKSCHSDSEYWAARRITLRRAVPQSAHLRCVWSVSPPRSSKCQPSPMSWPRVLPQHGPHEPFTRPVRRSDRSRDVRYRP